MEEIQVRLIRKLYSSDLNVSPVARHLRVTAILSSGLMLSRIKNTWHFAAAIDAEGTFFLLSQDL
ncbi:hypothetical protein P5673_003672 [Acropora cervicornis]|uniref:Uncharacterized protein n=1 Tax=Acropora cervicornis TaxID=6130 RepID=A0AAD9VEK3_ACRCE|nr:hypothetical protein P5673_003672 [Acropora cervicornis]